MQLNPHNTAVIVVDMQNDFCHPDGELFAPASQDALSHVNDVVSDARDAGASIVYTKDTHTNDQFIDNHFYDEFEQWGKHVIAGTEGAKLHDDLDVREDDHIVEKSTYDAFYGTNLHEWLVFNGILHTVFCGTLSNVCVLHSASSAALRDYHPIVLSDAVGYITPEHKDYSLEHADWLFGDVVESNEIEYENNDNE